MSAEMPLIVYVGEERYGEMLRQQSEALGWTVLIATSQLQALGMYVFYAPDLVVIDSRGNADGAQQVLFHLQSVDAQPLLVIAARSTADITLAERAGRVIGAAASTADTIIAVADLMNLPVMAGVG